MGSRIKRRRKKKRFEENKKLKSKLLKTKTQIDLPDSESSGQYWADSLSDADTVVDTNIEEDSSEESSEEEDISEGVKRVNETIGDASIDDIVSIIRRIKKAKENDNSTMGMISRSTDFRKAKRERLLMDSGAQVCIMGETMAIENKLEIKSLTKPRNVLRKEVRYHRHRRYVGED